MGHCEYHDPWDLVLGGPRAERRARYDTAINACDTAGCLGHDTARPGHDTTKPARTWACLGASWANFGARAPDLFFDLVFRLGIGS